MRYLNRFQQMSCCVCRWRSAQPCIGIFQPQPTILSFVGRTAQKSIRCVAVGLWAAKFPKSVIFTNQPDEGRGSSNFVSELGPVQRRLCHSYGPLVWALIRNACHPVVIESLASFKILACSSHPFKEGSAGDPLALDYKEGSCAAPHNTLQDRVGMTSSGSKILERLQHGAAPSCEGNWGGVALFALGYLPWTVFWGTPIKCNPDTI